MIKVKVQGQRSNLLKLRKRSLFVIRGSNLKCRCIFASLLVYISKNYDEGQWSRLNVKSERKLTIFDGTGDNFFYFLQRMPSGYFHHLAQSLCKLQEITLLMDDLECQGHSKGSNF